jgi:uncharacterized protein (TIGR03437 family)
MSDQFSLATSWPTALAASVVDDCGSPLINGSVVASFSNGDPPLSMVSLKDGRWTGTWAPRAAALQVTVTVDAELPGTTISGRAQVQGSLQANNNAPQIASGGVAPLLAPGSVITIMGSRLADSQTASSQPPLPAQLGGATVLLGTEALPLFSTSDQMIQAQVPFDVAVNTRQQLIVARGSAYTVPQSVTVAPAQPVILSVYDGSAPADQNHPVRAGDTLTLYCSGLGAVSPRVMAGVAAPADPISQVASPVTVTVGGLTTQVASASLTPGMTGMYQVTTIVPTGVPSGAAQVVVSIAGQSSAPGIVTAP